MCKRGKEEQVGHRQSRAHDPDAQSDAQSRSAPHPRPQWVHNCHVPEIRAAHFERHAFLDGILCLYLSQNDALRPLPSTTDTTGSEVVKMFFIVVNYKPN